MEADPSLDWLIMGLSNGSLIFYDVDRLHQTPFRIDNLQKKIMPKEKMSPVVSIEWHPRDIGTLLVGYNQSAIVYSLVSGEIKSVLVYQLSKEHRAFELASHVSHGGKKKMFGSSKLVIPKLKEAHFHPNGLHAVTVHEDNSIVFWDIASGTILEARNVFDVHIHQPGTPLPIPEVFHPIETVRWVCGEDPENTKLLISGGDPNATNCIHVLDFGYTLKYSITSNERQGEFYAQPQSGQRIIPLTFYLNKTEIQEVITTIQPITQNGSPYFHDGHDPSFLLLVSNLGQIYLVSFSESAGGQGCSDLGSVVLPTSVSFIHPPLCSFDVQEVRRIDWYSIMSNRISSGVTSKTTELLYGGMSAHLGGTPKPIGYSDIHRNILITGHERGLVRFLDLSKGEQQDLEGIVQIGLRETLFDYGNPATLRVTFVSCAFENRELLVGLASGDVVICKFGKHTKNAGISASKDYNDCEVQHSNGNAKLLDIHHRILGSITSSSSFLPVSLLQVDPKEEISVLKMSDVGFGAIGYKSGRLVVCDISRGPAVILNLASIKDHLVSIQGNCYPTSIEFTIQEYGNEGYSSILLLVGTNCGGNLVMFKIVPMGNGGFEVVFADKTAHLNYRTTDSGGSEGSFISQLIPINATSGASCVADMATFNKLSQGILLPGYVIATSDRDIRVLKLPKQKLSHKVVDDTCLKVSVVNYRDHGVVLAILAKTGFVKLCALPSLADIANIKLPSEVYLKVKDSLESGTATHSDLLLSGELFIRSSKTEAVYVSTQEKSRFKAEEETDKLFNENAIIPPRPSASALLWAKGQISYVSTEDLASLIAGPSRKPPKNIESQMAYNVSPEANPQNNYGGGAGAGRPGNNPRTRSQDKVSPYEQPVRRGGAAGGIGTQGFMRSIQNGIQTVEETFNDYANQASQTMTEGYEDQKKSMYSAAVKSRFGF
ncbi:Lethal(2) giant larvae SRO77 [Candida viswanathii]|uniref:Lethal(2) giant larvae SRO77 n=1 Tax=Candida viswanathii TaxID=5486 RepID=A0A367XY12_9ASCO|nr:Lethal(2) giant larvae SRO77 [Candida viswanathii]